MMQKRVFWALLAGVCAQSAAAEQFVSLTLCSDRLLREIARPEQIAAQSPYSVKPLMMLDKINRDKPTVVPTLSALLPYLKHTILLNRLFYPQLASQLERLGVKIIDVNDAPQTPEDFFKSLMALGQQIGNEAQANRLVQRLKAQRFPLKVKASRPLVLSDTGVVDTRYSPYPALFQLLELSTITPALTAQNFSLEKVLLSQPDSLLLFSDQQSYNAQGQWARHPFIRHYFATRPKAVLPLKYGYCFDHGLWQGAKLIATQLNQNKTASR